MKGWAKLPAQKTSPEDVANAILDGVVSGKEDIFPDPMSKRGLRGVADRSQGGRAAIRCVKRPAPRKMERRVVHVKSRAAALCSAMS